MKEKAKEENDDCSMVSSVSGLIGNATMSLASKQ